MERRLHRKSSEENIKDLEKIRQSDTQFASYSTEHFSDTSKPKIDEYDKSGGINQEGIAHKIHRCSGEIVSAIQTYTNADLNNILSRDRLEVFHSQFTNMRKKIE